MHEEICDLRVQIRRLNERVRELEEKLETPTNSGDVNRGACRRAAYAIEDAFSWEETPEGKDYWIEVYETLENRAQTGEW